MKIAIFGKKFGVEFREKCDILFRLLAENSVEVVIYRPFYDFLKKEKNISVEANNFFDSHLNLPDSNLIFSIGGDGTFLETVTYIRDRNIPIVGINSGRMGFLADISMQELPEAISEIINGKFNIRKVDLLRIDTETDVFGDMNFAMNELAIHKRDSASMITIHTYLNDSYLNSYWADGLIIATPIGSTAYSLSVGGPIVHPLCKEFIISPIAPHNLSVRPLVVPNTSKITLKVESRRDKFMASLDLRSKIVENKVAVHIRKADFTVSVAERINNDFFATLRTKLMWGADKRN